MLTSNKQYQWFKPEKDAEGKTSLVVPFNDGHKYEHPFDYLFDTKENAEQGLEEFDGLPDAIEEKWVLCEVVTTPLPHSSKMILRRAKNKLDKTTKK